MTAPLPTEKHCTACNTTKPAAEFYRCKEHGTDRLLAYCRPCTHAYNRDRLRHKYRTDPVYRERCKARERTRKRAQSKEHQEGREWVGRLTRHYLGILKAAGWRQADIARAIGISTSQMSSWVRGEFAPRSHHHIQALQQLGEATVAGRIVAPPSRQGKRPLKSEAR